MFKYLRKTLKSCNIVSLENCKSPPSKHYKVENSLHPLNLAKLKKLSTILYYKQMFIEHVELVRFIGQIVFVNLYVCVQNPCHKFWNTKNMCKMVYFRKKWFKSFKLQHYKKTTKNPAKMQNQAVLSKCI